jgi:LPXTG-motif cell wall-anchored protein
MRRFLVALALVLVGTLCVGGTATAQEMPPMPVATDFIDPETGEIDFEAYLAAVRAAEAARTTVTTTPSARAAAPARAAAATGTLPRTGSTVTDLVAAGMALVVVGGALVVSRRRRTVTADHHLSA